MNFRLRHKETGEFATGTFEVTPGVALAETYCGEHGRTRPNYEGTTVMWWDDQHVQTDMVTNELLFVTEGGDIYRESEFERVPVEEGDE